MIRFEVEGPVVVVTFVGESTDDEFDGYLSRMSGEIERASGPVATILDGSRAGATPAKQREKQARWLRQNAGLLRRKSAGTAFVITSPIIRGVLTAIFWIERPSHEYTIVETLPEARRWVNLQLANATREVDARRR